MGRYAFVCDITGRGGHGAMPHTAVDPVVAAAVLIRNADAGLKPGIGVDWLHVSGGTRFNIIPEHVSVSGVLLAPEADFEASRLALENTVAHIMSAFRTEGTLRFTEEVR